VPGKDGCGSGRCQSMVTRKYFRPICSLPVGKLVLIERAGLSLPSCLPGWFAYLCFGKIPSDTRWIFSLWSQFALIADLPSSRPSRPWRQPALSVPIPNHDRFIALCGWGKLPKTSRGSSEEMIKKGILHDLVWIAPASLAVGALLSLFDGGTW